MKSLYKVRMHKSWEDHHVLANSFQEAAEKVLNYIIEEGVKVDEDGSLSTPEKGSIKEITLVTDELIF